MRGESKSYDTHATLFPRLRVATRWTLPRFAPASVARRALNITGVSRRLLRPKSFKNFCTESFLKGLRSGAIRSGAASF